MINIKNFKILFYSLRPNHWIKNSVIFAPIFFNFIVNKEGLNLQINIQLFYAFIIFSLVASGIYIFNDLTDLKYDKLNSLKKYKPIADGKISVRDARLLGISVFFLGLVIIFISNIKINSLLFLLSYFILNIGYSLFLKHLSIIELMIIPLGFLFRIMIGFTEGEVSISFWMIVLTFLGAFLLIVGKRKVEFNLVNNNKQIKNLSKEIVLIRPVLKYYSDEFLNILIYITTSNIMVCYLIYLVSSNITSVYGHVTFITFLPVMYGLFRYIELICINKIKKDPMDILFKDSRMRYNLLIWISSFLIIFLNAKYSIKNNILTFFG